MKIAFLAIGVITALGIVNIGERNYDYEKAWLEVEKLISEGLPKSALEKTEEIHSMAVKEKNNPQIVKSLVYISRLTVQTDEKGIDKVIIRFNEGIQSATSPLKEILTSYLAELYTNYLSFNRYEIALRTNLTSETGDDFRTWSTQDFHKKVSSLYLASLADKAKLNDGAESFNEILTEYHKEVLEFRPSLYELLADRALRYFNEYSGWEQKYTGSFNLNDSDYFSDAKQFTRMDISGRYKSEMGSAFDEAELNSSPAYNVLKLYQDIIGRQIEKNQKVALASYDFKRLEFAYNQSELEDKYELYRSGLEKLAEESKDHFYYSEIVSAIAALYQQETTDSNSVLKALEWCEKGIQAFPDSKGGEMCRNIIRQIKAPFIQLYGESVYPSGKSLLVALDYNNLMDVNLDVVKIEGDLPEQYQRSNYDAFVQYIRSAKAIHSIQKKLPASPLYKKQRMELAMNALPYGNYALRANSSDDDSTGVFQYILFSVSDLSYTTWMEGTRRVYLITDRLKGTPLSKVKLTLYANEYDAAMRKTVNRKISEWHSGKDGKVIVQPDENRSVKAVLSKGKDTFDGAVYQTGYRLNQQQTTKFAEIFTDRSIYRPGQSIYYKAIFISQDANRIPSILKNESADVILRDANYQVVSTVTQKSNEFGSINGSFTIPTDKLTGSFTIEIVSKAGITGYRSVQIEEYKRPTFEVTFEPVTQTFKVNDNIVLKGSAKTLAGSNVDNAMISYKITRSARFPGWDWWWRSPYPSNEFVIAKGAGITDANGIFEVTFEALPDRKIKKTDFPVFHYQVEVDVTDQRGETRTASSTVSAGYSAFSLSTDIAPKTERSEIKTMTISATNTNNQPVTVSGRYSIFLLKAPEEVKINKYWDGITDIPIPYPEHKKIFPQYPFKDELDFSSWAIAKKITDAPFKSGESIPIASLFKAGAYRIEMVSADSEGNEVKSIRHFVVTDFNNKQFPKSAFLFSRLNQSSFEPGDQMIFKLGSSDKTVYANVLVEKDGKMIFSNVMKVSSVSQIQIPVKEQHRGGLNIVVSYIIQNRKYEERHHVSVPWTNKQLVITFESFRDKTLPGSKESYNIKIKGKNKDKVAAEMLAAMYDASLDQFTGHNWRQGFYPESYSYIYTEIPGFQLSTGRYYGYGNKGIQYFPGIRYPEFIALFDGNIYGYGRGNDYYMDGVRTGGMRNAEVMMKSAVPADAEADAPGGQVILPDENLEINEEADVQKTVVQQPPRTNLKETVFFFPDLKTDQDGNVILSFTMNEALTKWRLMSFVHTEDFKTGYDERTVQTSKDLMVFPNPPRFLRDGDKLSFSAKVTNLREEKITGTARLTIKDAISMKDITSELLKSPVVVRFLAEKGQSEALSWDLEIPEAKYQAITWTVSAESGSHTDAEENTLPVLTNRIMITESIPVWVKGNESKTVVFKAFKDNVSITKKDFKYTFEYTAHPVWYAVQALPYIQNTGIAGTQSLIDRFFTNALASKIANAHPRMKAVFDRWQNQDKEALLSNLSKNEALKSAILEETPWVRQALSESEQKRNIAILFDLNRLAGEKESIIKKLAERQLSNGGFPWFEGGRDDIYTTQQVLELIGQLNHLGALDLNETELTKIISTGLQYMDERLAERYKKLLENISRYGGKKEDDHLDELSVHYLYVRSFFKKYRVKSNAIEARDYYMSQSRQYWLKRNLYTQAMIGLIMHRNSDATAGQIIKSLRERSFSNEELGTYWNEGNGFYWYQLPIERHAMMIAFFNEAGAQSTETDRMKIWLLKNKQTNHWKTSKATAAAIYALLVQGEQSGITPWITEMNTPEIQLGNINIEAGNNAPEAGTGYIRQSWEAGNFTKDMASITVRNNNSSVAWGAAFYQYLELPENVKGFEDTPLKINKKWYKVLKNISGDQLEALHEGSRLKPGDKIKVRIELTVDRNMEYVMMKDMRPSGFEPVNTISGYKYQGGLGYYESTKDVATYFYFSFLPKGTYVFEYPLTVVHKGDFTGGITSIESMYAPEFRSHSSGSRIKVGE